MPITKMFIISPRGEFCIGTYQRMPPHRIIEEARMCAQARGYPMRIEWAHPDWDDLIVSHRSDELLALRQKAKQVAATLEDYERNLGATTRKSSRQKVLRQIRRTKKELRRIRKLIAKHEHR